MLRTCQICGNEFQSDAPRKICYDDHYKTCPMCGKSVLWNRLDEFKGCKKCNQVVAVKRRKETMMKKYGAPTTLQSESLSKKVKETVKSKYGVDNAMQSKEIQTKAAQTNIDRYGCPNPMSNEEIAKKSAATRSENMDEIVQHIKQAWMKKYGVDNVSKCPEIIDKITDTFMKRYGVKRAISVPEFRQKMINTMLKRYDAPWYIQSADYRSKDNFKNSKINELFASKLQENDIEFEQEYRIDFKNYDFYVPKFKALIEINPSYTHNVIGNHWNKNGIDKDYHSERSKLAKANGLKCIHIFDWDNWETIINMLMPRKVIYARQCKILKLYQDVADDFLSKYHLQGTCRGQDVCLGLVQDNELYMVMTFGKPRYNNNYAAELLRLATRPGYSVVGGASKLFNYFVKTFEIDSIISYCDLSKFSGDVYEKIGMTYLKCTPPQEIWSKDNQRITANLLRQRGYDQLFGTDYGKGTSNEQLMLDHGWLPVYDCGQAVYTYGEKLHHKISRKSVDMKPKTRQTKLCKFCNKPFIPRSNRQQYCQGPHYRNCPVCGKEYLEDNVENLKRPPVACSYKCRSKLANHTKSNKL